MRTVHKFKVPFSVEASPSDSAAAIPLPQAAKIVHVGIDPDSLRPAIWVEYRDERRASQHRQFRAFGTGKPLPDNWTHCGSAISDTGLVWHVYEGPAE